MEGHINDYLKNETLAKNQLDLILQVYDGAIGAFRDAAEQFRVGDAQSGRDQLGRARRFITHLYTTLDREQGGEVADNLGQMYAWLISQINVAEATKDLKIIDDNINILVTIREGWQGLKLQNVSSEPTAPASMPEGSRGSFSGSA